MFSQATISIATRFFFNTVRPSVYGHPHCKIKGGQRRWPVKDIRPQRCIIVRESFSEHVSFQREATFRVKWLYCNLLLTPNLRPCIDNKIKPGALALKVRGRNNRDRNRLLEGGRYSLQWPIRGSSARRGSFFRLQVYQRVRITLVEVYERIGKSVISVVRRLKRAHRSILWP